MNNTLQMRLHAIMLRVTNLERSRKWYTETLGFTVAFEDSHYKLLTLRDQGEGQLAIWELRPGEIPTVATQEAAYPVFISTHASEDHRLLAARGANPEPIQDYPHGLRVFWVSDPDGHRICVLEFMME